MLKHGWTRARIARALDEGTWQKLAPGVYFIGATEIPWPSLAWAGALIGGDDARIGGLAAAHLHTLTPDPPDTITVLIPAAGSRPRSRDPWSFHRERPGARSGATRGSPPRISVEDTVLDLATDRDPAAVVTWVTAATGAWLTTPKRLRSAMAARRYVPQRRVLEQLLPDVTTGAQSSLELAYLKQVERAHGLPAGRRQARRRGTYADVLYEDYGLLVELDGRLNHEGERAFRDMNRDNAATVDGLATLRFGHRNVIGDPCEVAFQVASVLAGRGWRGLLQRCPRCLLVA